MSRIRIGVGLALLIATTLNGCTSETEGFCEKDSDCPAGQRCNTTLGRCEATAPDGGLDGLPGLDALADGDLGPSPDQGKLQNGSACSAAGECESGFCADGVCCDGDCDGTCRSCKLAGSEGTCTLAPDGDDPDADCKGTDVVCDGTCDGFGQCTYPDSSKPCGAPTCSAGELISPTCDGSGGCSSTKTSCGGFACDTSVDTCKTSCLAKADCMPTFECVSTVCSKPQPNGSACGTNNAACQSGHCVEGYCCDSDCTNPCQSCALAGKLGTCSAVSDYTGCGAETCTGSTKVDQACIAGTCTPVTTQCAPFLCNPTMPACLSACSDSTQCVATAYCDGNKDCQPKKPNGGTCSSAEMCQSTFCVAGVCCDNACSPAMACVDGASSSTTTLKSCGTGACTSTTKPCGLYKCDATKTDCLKSCTSDAQCVTGYFCVSGTCQKKPLGAYCTAGSECQSTFCTENVCCNDTCNNGPCQSCKVTGKEGTCSYVPANTICDDTLKCVNSTGSSYLTKGRCDGKSSVCKDVKELDCFAYKCSGSACLTSCAAHADCVSTVCDLSALFGTQNTCIAESDICYAESSMPAPGAGTRQSPYPKIQTCLGTAKRHIAIADGIYDENLTISRQAALWGTDTAGTLVQHGLANASLINAIIQKMSGTVVSVTPPAAANKVILWGLRVNRPQAGTGMPPLVDIVANGPVMLHTVDVAKNGGACVRVRPLSTPTPQATLTLEDASLGNCETAVDADAVHLVVRNAGIGWMPKGIGIVHIGSGTTGNAYLTLEDLHIGYCGTVATPLSHAIRVVDSDIKLDRIRIANSVVDYGIYLENYVPGLISNAQVSGAGVGLSSAQDLSGLTIVNSTFTDNASIQVSCGSTTKLYNSILWKKNVFVDSWTGGCSFYYSQVQKDPGSTVPGSNNGYTDPTFDTVDALNPYYRLSPGSPCRDVGTTIVPGLSPFLTKDLFNAPRVANGQVDKGALEYQP